MKTKAEKYIDLGPQIFNTTGLDMPSEKRLASIHCVLRWLDEHPEQVPGRTITQSELRTATYAAWGYAPRESDRMFLARFGITVAPDPDPDPEPTNADRLESKLRAFALEVCISEPQLDLAQSSAPELAAWLDSRGVKAPEAGSDDE